MENIRKYLSKIIQADMICYETKAKTISWSGREPGVLSNTYYPLEYQKLIDRRQYSILLSDLSFFQFYYRFDDNEKLLSARLCFYPSPAPLESQDLEDIREAILYSDPLEHDDYIYNHIERLEEFEIEPVNTSHIRFDYDSSATSHEPSHMQFSGVNELRLPANFYPLPTTFIEMVMGIIADCPTIGQGDLLFASRNLKITTSEPLYQTIKLSSK